MADKKVTVTVLVGTVDNGTETFTRGGHMKLAESEAKALEEVGIVKTGKHNLDEVTADAETKEVVIVIDNDRLLAFVDAVETLEPGNEDHWTADNKPDVNALKAAGFDLNAAERDALWAKHQEMNS